MLPGSKRDPLLSDLVHGRQKNENVIRRARNRRVVGATPTISCGVKIMATGGVDRDSGKCDCIQALEGLFLPQLNALKWVMSLSGWELG